MNIRERLSVRRLMSDPRGLTTVEYVIVLAMIAVMSVGLWKSFGSNIKNYLSGSSAAIDASMSGVVPPTK